jgi:hypothetical protein
MNKLMKLFVLSLVIAAAGARADGGHGSTGKETPKGGSKGRLVETNKEMIELASRGHGSNGRTADLGGGVGSKERSSGHGSNG